MLILNGRYPLGGGVAPLTRLPNLRRIDLALTGIEAADVAALSALTKLKALYLKNAPLTLAALRQLDYLPLERLTLSGGSVLTIASLIPLFLSPNTSFSIPGLSSPYLL